MKNRKKIQAYLMRIGFIPKYTEVSLFLTSLILILLLFISNEFRDFIVEIIFSKNGISLIVLGIISIIASVYFAFSKKKPELSGPFIVIFMILMNVLIAIKTGDYVLRNTKGILGIFPLLNMIYALLSIVLLKVGLIDENSLPDHDAKIHEIIIGAIVLTLIVIYSHYYLKSYWAMTFSMALTYATMASEKVTGMFFKESQNNSQKTI